PLGSRRFLGAEPLLKRLGISAKLVLATTAILLLATPLLDWLVSSEFAGGQASHEGSLYTHLVVDAALLLIVAMAVGAAAMALVTRPLRRLTRFALVMPSGNVSSRAPGQRSVELAELADALAVLSGKLSRAKAEARMERDLLAGILDGMSEGVLVLDR